MKTIELSITCRPPTGSRLFRLAASGGIGEMVTLVTVATLRGLQRAAGGAQTTVIKSIDRSCTATPVYQQRILVSTHHVRSGNIRGNQVSLGVDAHRDVPVHRKEVQTAIKRAEARKESSGESEPTRIP